MAKIHGRNTGPERLVRRLLTRLRVRFTLHDRHLPGKPDIVVRSMKTAVFVHGCFWHRHRCRRGRSVPSTRPAFWRRKLAINAARDQRQARQLRRFGWHVLIVWECQTHSSKRPQLLRRLQRLLGGGESATLPRRRLTHA
jgi:DNA mismatch endonuclease (patch repair protein)